MTDRETATHDLLRALRDYAAAAREASLPGLVQLKIREVDLKAVRYLLEHPGARAGELSQHLGISTPSTSVLIDRLTAKGLVRREASPSDRRVTHVHATVDPAAEPWSSLERFDALAGRIAAGWSADAVEEAARLVAAMARAAEAFAPGS